MPNLGEYGKPQIQKNFVSVSLALSFIQWLSKYLSITVSLSLRDLHPNSLDSVMISRKKEN